MKRIITLLVALSLITTTALAIPAKKGPIQITQPDGSSLTIELHGDEFLSWTTVNGGLVAQKEDGFYYHASFDAGGYIVASNSKVTNAGFTRSGASTITPPQAAIARANALKEQMYSSMRSNSSEAQNSISTGSKKFLTILVEFPDIPFTYPNSSFENLLNEDGYSLNGATGSAKNYYSENSGGKFDPTFVIAGPYTVSKNHDYYGARSGNSNDSNVQELFTEVLKLADPDIDFSQYDLDNDGYIDNLFFYYSGYNEAEGGPSTTIWPHKWALFYEPTILDGKTAFGYACTSEFRGASGETLCGIGTFTHEFGHVLSLPDFYDTNYNTGGSAPGLGIFSLMNSGGYNNNGNTPPYFNIIERQMLGWLEEDIKTLYEAKEYTILPVENDDAYMSPTATDGEFFVYESRGGQGWDKYIPTGLLIYHIDRSNRNVDGMTAKRRWENGRGINDLAAHQCFNLIESCGNESNIRRDHANVPFPGSLDVTSFTATTNPAAVDWDDKATGYNLTNIKDNGAAGVSFTLSNSNIPISLSGTIKDSNGSPLAGALVNIQLLEGSIETTTDQNGAFAFEAPAMAYATVTVTLDSYAMHVSQYPLTSIESLDIVLLKSRFKEKGYNYILLEDREYNDGDQLVLKLQQYSTATPKSILWVVNTQVVDPNDPITLKTGEYVISAIISYDTHTESIRKTLIVNP